MEPKFKTVFRGLVFALLALLFWSIWASAAQPVTNALAPATALPATVASHEGALVEELTKLDEQYLTFGLDRVAVLRDHKFFNEPLWKYFASLIYIFLAFSVSKFLDYLVNAWLKKWAAKTETRLDDLLLEVLHGPVKVVAFVILLNIGLNVFSWRPGAQAFLSKALIIVVASSLTYAVIKVVDLLMGLWRQRSAAGADKSFDEQLFPLISKTLKIFVVIVAVLVTSQNLGINMTGALASLSVGALAVGLAAQDTLANLFGAVAVYMDKPFRIGDRIKLDGVDGTVESIGLRSTRVRSVDGHHVTIPNKTVGNATITNVTRRPNIKTEMNIGLTYDTPVEKVRRALKILEEVYRAHPKTAELTVSFNKFADSALNIQVVHAWNGTDQKEHLAGMQELNLKVKERFDAERISFAFPTQTLLVKQDSEWRVEPVRQPQPQTAGAA
jgi:MscS family membrane protein